MNNSQIELVFSRLEKNNPQPTTELHYSNGFELLVAVVLSAQATDIRVNIVTKKLFSLANTPEAMLELGEKTIRETIKSIGLYQNKAKNVIKLSQQIIDEHHHSIPQTLDQLTTLAGVGRKTANVILNTLYGHLVIAVDTHVYRVSKRLGIALKEDKTPLAVEKRIIKRIPKRWLRHAHHWLILHGRYICKAKQPSCTTCPLNDLCDDFLNRQVDSHSNH